MTVPCADGIINIRVGAIIMKNGKLLMVGGDGPDYLVSVGGRVKFGEPARTLYEQSKSAINRRFCYKIQEHCSPFKNNALSITIS